MSAVLGKDYLAHFLRVYYPLHFFALFRAHELYNVEPYIHRLRRPILDLGCGDGIVAESLFGRPLEYGIDPSGAAVKAARERGVYDTVLHGDAHTIPLEDGSLGGVFSNCVLEHVPELPTLVSELARVLKPGAYVVATALSPFFYILNPLLRSLDRPWGRWLRRRMMRAEDRLHRHVSVHGMEEYRRMFEEKGFVVETLRYYAPPVIARFCLSWTSAVKYVVPYPVLLTHNGLLRRYLNVRFRYLADREKTLEQWHERFSRLCYVRNGPGEIGAGLILVARNAGAGPGK